MNTTTIAIYAAAAAPAAWILDRVRNGRIGGIVARAEAAARFNLSDAVLEAAYRRAERAFVAGTDIA